MNKRILLFFGGSVLLIVLGVATYFGINIYSFQDRGRTESSREFDRAYIAAMTADNYGGQTAQETFDLFVSALRADDAEMASKYFMLNDNLSRDRWVKALAILKDKGLLTKMAEELKPSGVDMEYNKYSKVWKIVNI